MCDASLSGIVLQEEGDCIVLRCDNGRLAEEICISDMEDEMPDIIGQHVEIEGKTSFINGVFVVFPDEIRMDGHTYKDKKAKKAG